jgi:hypothetical protein
MNYTFEINAVFLIRLLSVALIIYYTIAEIGKTGSYLSAASFGAFIFGFWVLGYASKADK